MPIQKITKEEIILKSIEIFRKQGFHKTSMKDLADACGLFKGSFYHYFESKEKLLEASLQYSLDFFREKIFMIAYQEELSPTERLDKMLQKQIKIVTYQHYGCFFGSITLDTTDLHQEAKEILQLFFEEWQKAMKHIYQSKYTEEEAQQKAFQAITSLEGAILLAKLSQNDYSIHQTCEIIRQNLAHF